MQRRGVTLVELLVVIAIIGILVALLLPAVQAAREAGRTADCRNRIHQLAIAFQSHHAAYGHFAGDGWGWRWVGDPDRGSGERQPGGWVYRILPFIEGNIVTEMGRDGLPDEITETQRQGLAMATQQHLGWFNCPTRRPPRLTQLTTGWSYINMARGELTASISYDANWGSDAVNYQGGPTSPRMDLADTLVQNLPESNGIVYPLSEVSAAQITDGLSKTYLVGDNFYWITNNTDNPDGSGMHTPLSNYYVSSGNDPPLRDMLPGSTIDRENDRWGSTTPRVGTSAFVTGASTRCRTKSTSRSTVASPIAMTGCQSIQPRGVDRCSSQPEPPVNGRTPIAMRMFRRIHAIRVLLTTFVCCCSFLPTWNRTAYGDPLTTGTVGVGQAGHELYYETKGSGEPLLLIHGLTLDRRMWDAQFDFFAQYYRVIRYDVIGHGNSSGLDGPISNGSVRRWDHARELLDALKVDQAHVAGLSMGGRIAINFALEYPDRVQTLTSIDGDLQGYAYDNSPGEFLERISDYYTVSYNQGLQAALPL